MILDKIENANLYRNIHPGIGKAFDYIKSIDFSNLSTGKHEIDGDALFAILNAYETAPVNGKLMESHLRYIDVQYVVEGVEEMGITTKCGQTPKKAYDSNDDYMLFDGSYDVITVKEGMFAIFFPDDIHMPEITTNKPSKVKKLVIKVKIQNS